MSAKKPKEVTMVLVNGNALIEDGSAFRINLMRIIFRVMAKQFGGQAQDYMAAGKVINAAYLTESDLADTVTDIEKFEKECIGYINYTAYYTPEQIEEQGEKLYDICEKAGVKVGMGCLLRQMNMRNMASDMSIWRWTI